MSEERRITRGSGNVFADLGFAEPEAELAKAKLVREIARVIAARGWTQVRATQAMGIGQPKVSALLRGRFEGYSTDRLMHLLNRLDQDVTITVTPKPAGRPRAGIAVSTDEDRIAAPAARAADDTGVMF